MCRRSRRSASPNRFVENGNRSGAGSVQGVGRAVDGPFGAGRCSSRGTRPKEVDAMRAIRSATVARSLGASVLVLLVLALASCGTSEMKSVDGGVSVGREPAGVDSPAGPGEDLAQSSEGAVRITKDPPSLGEFGRKVVKTADLGLRAKEVRE